MPKDTDSTTEITHYLDQLLAKSDQMEKYIKKAKSELRSMVDIHTQLNKLIADKKSQHLREKHVTPPRIIESHLDGGNMTF